VGLCTVELPPLVGRKISTDRGRAEDVWRGQRVDSASVLWSEENLHYRDVQCVSPNTYHELAGDLVDPEPSR